MTLFSWLFVAHMVGDWLLQNDWMAANKQKRLFTTAGFAHFGLYTLCLSLTMWWVRPQGFDLLQLGYFALGIFVSHWFIDALNAASHWGRVIQQSDLLFVRIASDQTLHILALALLLHFLT